MSISANSRFKFMKIKRNLCIFCENGKSFKSKEHVFPQWILEELDFRNNVRPFSETQVKNINNSKIDFSRETKNLKNFGNYVSPFVCDDCNHGWMSNLEGKIKPILLPLINGTSSLNILSKEEKILISRWAAKTTCVIDSVNQPTNLIYLAAEPSKIRTSPNLPPGWAVFAKTHSATNPIGFVTNDFWWIEGNVSKELEEKLKQYKRTIIQLKNLILVTVFIGDIRLKLKAVKLLHFPININLNIEWLLHPAPPSFTTFQNLEKESTENLSSEFIGALSLEVL